MLQTQALKLDGLLICNKKETLKISIIFKMTKENECLLQNQVLYVYGILDVCIVFCFHQFQNLEVVGVVLQLQTFMTEYTL